MLLAGLALACLTTLAPPAQAAGKKVMLVVRVEGKSLPFDEKIKAHLESRGFAVTLQSQYKPVEESAGADLVILSSTIRSHDLLGAYRDIKAPLLTWEQDLLDDLSMSGKRAGVDYGTVEKVRYLWLVNAPHPLAAGLPAGVVDAYEKQATMSWGKPGLGATTIATIYGEPEKAAIFGYEQGATMDYEALAPARRVMFFLDNETFGNLSPAGRKLFDAAVDWALAAPQAAR
ncbi:hypothetical protein [Duganella aceris]|uniref:Lipoprotein transmembrane n=1 Tax=Duganella aceris TaxID=2703883 RepID=A0ABX0FJQ5_9BURK|nr:hypothetical protein [Duganella aceris]NGZ84792.1 hypothetical protein [Duganella aceris]